MNRFLLTLLAGLLYLVFSTGVFAVPQCDAIFTDPPTGNHNPGLVPPDDIGPRLGNLSCFKGACSGHSPEFSAGDYDFATGSFGNRSVITTTGKTARLYFDNLSMNNASINASGKAENLIIYVRGDLSVAGQNYINGILYVAGTVTFTGNAWIDGAIASGGSLSFDGNGGADVDLGAVDDADFGGMCDKGGVSVDHYRLEFTSDALSCAAKDILLRACVNADCSTQASVSSSVELTKDGVKYADVGFTGSAQTQVWHPDGGSVRLGLGATAPAAPYRCYIDGALVDNLQCLLDFADTGFYFDVPDSTACKTGSSFNLFAVTKDTQTQQCKPLFANQTKTISFGFDYLRPATVNNPAKLTLNSLLSPTGSVAIDGGGTQAMQVHFNGEGVASLSANYPEAGVVTLSAEHSHTVSRPAGGSETLVLSHSDNFTSAPAGFHFANVSANGRCDAGDPYDAGCKVLAAAGEPFSMQVTAACWQSDEDKDFSGNTALQNFEHNGLSVVSQVVQPDTGVNGVLGRDSLSFSLSSGVSAQIIDDQSWSEVGTMQVALGSDVSYEGVTIPASQSSSEVFGRFTPAYLSITGNTPEAVQSCGTFTYLDQPFGFKTGAEPSIQVAGFDAQGRVTTNYQNGDWWRYKHRDEAERNQWSERSYQDGTKKAVIADSQAPAHSGQVNYRGSPNVAELIGAQPSYQRTQTPQEPFDAKFDLVLSALDVSDEDGICYRDSASAPCRGFTFSDIGDGKAFELRYGRMVLENGYGPQSESLRLPLRSEYVSSATAGVPVWTLNGDDNCSVFNTQTSLDAGETATSGLYRVLPSGFPDLQAYSDSGLSLRSGALVNGVGNLYFAIPNQAGELPLKLHVEPWLKGYWNYPGDAADTLFDPRANAYFGTYRGHDKIIYWREVK
ncbi:MSHA biogenesis protein MshQ [Shewanella sp. JBTF-M18]|uniref:MSHA biogenesis protein MshQ n=1 Tax=Shewanella insulae TaxID=2681496 RepID=A0A6L7HY80_9GAMM|nr:MSHA biogenesis protein MshQ [Shewanella insulae]